MIMIVVNTIVLYTKLKLSPLKFLRHDLNHWREKRQCACQRFLYGKIPDAYPDSEQGKLSCDVFRRNICKSAHFLRTFDDTAFRPLRYAGRGKYDQRLPVRVKNAGADENEAAEKYAVKSLILDKTDRKLKEEINVYGIREDSDYITGIELQKRQRVYV